MGKDEERGKNKNYAAIRKSFWKVKSRRKKAFF